jgi:stalled ribosome alternative rescue factor ArfA
MDKNSFSVELLRAASSCGQSLQKALALPMVASLCSELAEALYARAWKPGIYTRFAVQEPKLREIFAPDFADRVVEAWLVALVEKPLSRLFIEDTYANRKGKGTYAAINKAQKLMRSPGHEWCLQLDVRSFFTSIHRPTLLRNWIDFLNGIGQVQTLSGGQAPPYQPIWAVCRGGRARRVKVEPAPPAISSMRFPRFAPGSSNKTRIPFLVSQKICRPWPKLQNSLREVRHTAAFPLVW